MEYTPIKSTNISTHNNTPFNAVTTIASVVGATITDQTDKVVRTPRQLMNNQKVLRKLILCLNRLTQEEYKSRWWGKTEEGVRKANLYMNAAFNYRVNAQYRGELESNSENILLEAKKARLEARQLNQLFSCLLHYNANSSICKLNQTCAELFELFALKNEIESKLADNAQAMADIASYAQHSNKFESLKLQIQASCQIFRVQLQAVLSVIAKNGEVGFKQLLDRINSNDIEEIFNFLQVYAVKVRYLTDNKYAGELKDDLSKYIVARSVGLLSAQLVIEAKYGKVIADILTNSFLGDIQSKENNLSKYFMETLYFLLDDKTGQFSLSCLCIGDKDSVKKGNVSVIQFGTSIQIAECRGAYNLLNKRKHVVSDIVDYYHDLSKITVGDNLESLIEFGVMEQEMLIWNLLGGESLRLGEKKGLLFRIDEQLQSFSGPRSDENIYSVHNIFHDSSNKEEFMEDLASKSEKTKKAKSPDLSNIFQLSLFEEKFALTEIAKDVIYNIDSSVKNDKKLNYLRQEYELILEAARFEDKSILEEYFKNLVNTVSDSRRLNKFMKLTKKNLVGYESQIASIQIPKKKASNLLISDFLSIQTEKLNSLQKRKFELKFGCDTSIMEEHITQYSAKLGELKSQIEDSQLFKYIKNIFSDLEMLNQFVMFCDEINKGNATVDKSMTRIAPIPQLVIMSENAVDMARKSVQKLYDYYMSLKCQIETSQNNQDNEISEGDIIQLAMLEILFDFSDKNSGNDTAPIRDFINVFDQVVSQNFPHEKLNFTDFELLNARYLAIPKQLLSIYFTQEVIEYFNEANNYINSNNFKSIKKRVDKNNAFILWSGNKVLNRKNVLLHQDKNALLSQTVDKIKDNLGRFTYIDSSISALESYNKFRLESIARKQFEIVKNLMIICSKNNKLANDQQIFCRSINICIKSISDSELDLNEAKNVFDEVMSCFGMIFQNNFDDIEKEISISDKRTIEVKLIYKERKKIFELYHNLTRQDFSVSLSKVPSVYSAIFQGVGGGIPSTVKAFRVMGAFYTLGVLDQIAVGAQTNSSSAYVEIFSNLASLQSFDLMSLVTINYLHSELMSNFSAMNRIVGKFALEVSNNIHLIQKLLMVLVNNDTLDLTSTSIYLDENEKSILQSVTSNFENWLEIKDPLEFSKVRAPYLKVKLANGKTIIFDSQLLIKQISANLGNQDKSSADKNEEIEELCAFVNKATRMSEDLSAIQLSWNVQEQDFTHSLSKIAKTVGAIGNDLKSGIKLDFIQSKEIDNLNHLACFFDTVGATVEDGIITYNLSSNAVSKFKDLFNLCFKTLNVESSNTSGIAISRLYTIRGLLEKAINNLNEGNVLQDYEVKLFNNVSNLTQPDEEIAELVKLRLSKSQNESIKQHLEELMDNYKGNKSAYYVINAFKYYLNLFQYHKLSDGLSKFYTEHYFNLKTVERYYGEAILLIIEINKENESTKEISTIVDLQFSENITRLDKLYKSYRTNSEKVLSKHINVYSQKSLIYQLLSKVTMYISPEQQKYNVKTHEWFIKMFDINDILEQLSGNDVPHMRTMLYLSGIFDYLEVFYPNLSNDDDFMTLRKYLLKLYTQSQPYKINDGTNIINIKSILSKLIKKLEGEEDNIKDEVFTFFNNISGNSSETVLLDEVIIPNLGESIHKPLIILWQSLFQVMNAKLEEYNKDLELAKNYVKGESYKKNQISDLEQLLPQFNGALSTYCEEQLNSMEKLSLNNVHSKLAELIKENWQEFAKLCMSDNPETREKFDQICKLSFMQDAIYEYLTVNYSNLMHSCTNDTLKVFKLILTFSAQLQNAENLNKMISGDAEQLNLLALFFANPLHKEKFQEIIASNLKPDNFNQEIFTKDVFDFLSFYQELAKQIEFDAIVNDRLTTYGLSEPTYGNLCETYEFDKLDWVKDSNLKIIRETTSDGEYFGQVDSGGKKNGYGIMAFSNNDKYLGKWKDGGIHGRGKMIANGNIYKGGWEDDKCGTGKIIFNDNSTYIGQWQCLMLHGQGQMNYADGRVYDGQWSVNKRHGQGQMTIIREGESYVYQGEWRDSNYGTGVITLPNGSTYEGEWYNFSPHGQGTMTDCDKNIYKGNWLNGQKVGKGSMEYADGRVYDGQWVNDKRNGQGTMKYSNGNMYNGGWQMGLRHGQGTLTDVNKNIMYQGVWNNDKMMR